MTLSGLHCPLTYRPPASNRLLQWSYSHHATGVGDDGASNMRFPDSSTSTIGILVSHAGWSVTVLPGMGALHGSQLRSRPGGGGSDRKVSRQPAARRSAA